MAFFGATLMSFLEKNLKDFSLNLSHGSEIFLLILTLSLVLASAGLQYLPIKKKFLKRIFVRAELIKFYKMPTLSQNFMRNFS